MHSLAGRAILVTGHRGFIAGRLTECLQRAGVQPITLEQDIRDPIQLDCPVDVVLHLAGVSSPQRFAEEPDRSFHSNVGGTLNVLELCRIKHARLVFASTCGVYGPTGETPVPETRKPNPTTVYARSKRLGEQLCEAYARVYRVPSVILRLFNVYGGGQRGPWLIPYLVGAARAGRTAMLRAVNARRDLVHVSDVVQAFGLAAVYEGSVGIFNVGSGRLVSVLELVRCLEAALGKPISYQSIPGDRDEVEGIVADLARAAVQLRWSPEVNLEEGLLEVAAFAGE